MKSIEPNTLMYDYGLRRWNCHRDFCSL